VGGVGERVVASNHKRKTPRVGDAGGDIVGDAGHNVMFEIWMGPIFGMGSARALT
jgi:hypothetical protein